MRPSRLLRPLHGRRPVLRVQLTLLYAGLVIGVLAAVLLALGLLRQHSSQRAPAGTPAHQIGTGARSFEVGPALIGLAAALIALGAAWWLAGRVLRPLRAMTAAAQEIFATNLDRRLDLAGPSDELTDLGATLNNLFARLQSAFEAQRHFVANASHELRTPLAGQRTLLQVALADTDADVPALRTACEDALHLGDMQEQLIDALLTLATSERGVERWEPLDLAEITRTVLTGRREAADRLGIRIDAALQPAPATGDPTLVERLIANLVDNALHHNHDDGTVTTTTTTIEGSARIAVTNTGPMIAATDLDRLFRPFQRAAGPRLALSGGNGLGLAIVQAIAEAHGARLTSTTNPDGGLNITVSFAERSAAASARSDGTANTPR